MKTKYSLIGLAALLLLSLLAGWLNRNQVAFSLDAQRLTVWEPWAGWAPGVASGVFLTAIAGVLLGGVARGKSRRAALLLLIVGLAWTAAAAATGPFVANAADPQAIQFGEGVLGQGYTRRFTLGDVERIEVYRTRRRPDGRKKTRRQTTIAELHHADGQVDYLSMHRPLRSALLEHVLSQARERGIDVNDRRED
ncbi:hypothetical protein Pla123a_02830 [Posidoniimonas polymericola]|uniref:Uncharacterized protein n=1 Tax=Posidoniimonas polymericola TaxID=2528002 RepID=A0A5C5ZE97_9BACT|nr:hypothetical protein [Posidoniimonas polymericola]TWT85476.1 hypothetical protein Pla123a_02830 [Posidoniimonas polymericola]